MSKSIGSFLNRPIRFLVKHEWLVVLLFFVFLLRIPTLFEPNWYGDEEIYLVMGQGLRKGLVFYRDIFDHKPPLIYVLAAVVKTVFWFRLLLMGIHAISVIVFAKLSDLLYKNRLAVMLSTTAYSLLSTLPTLEGNIANGENFMVVPAMMGMYLVYKDVVSKNKTQNNVWLGAGMLFSIAFLVKVPIVFDFIAAGLYWWLLAKKDISFVGLVKRLFSKPIVLTMVGFLLPIGISVVYYWSVGAFEPYVRSVLLQNIGYIESWRGGESGGGSALANPLVWRMLLIMAFVAVLLKFKSSAKISRGVVFLSVWLLFSLYGALLSNRPYPHYLLQPLVPAVFLAGLVLDDFMKKRWKKDVFLVSLGIVVSWIMMVEIGFWNYPTISYYKNFASYAMGKIDRQTYEDYFPSSLKRNKEIADYLRERTGKDERVFVWGEEPAIYDLSDRLPLGRYIVSFHIRDFPNGYKETYQEFIKKMPRYVVVIPNQVPSFPELEILLQTDYLMVHQIDNVLIYKLVEPLAIYR